MSTRLFICIQYTNDGISSYFCGIDCLPHIFPPIFARPGQPLEDIHAPIFAYQVHHLSGNLCRCFKNHDAWFQK